MPYIIILVLILSILIIYLINKFFFDKDRYRNDVSNLEGAFDEVENGIEDKSSRYLEGNRYNSRKKLINSLDSNYKKIVKAYEFIDRDLRNKNDVVPAAEWLLDNLYLIEKEYKDIKHNMPISYYTNLPIIVNGIMKGLPRIYFKALDIVIKTDGRLEEDYIKKYIKENQKGAAFTSGELWAFPIMLRIAIIQNLGNVVEQISFAQKEKNRAESVADRMINATLFKDNKSAINQISDEFKYLSPHFIERLIKVLRDNGVDNNEIYKWIDDRLAVMDSSVDRMINVEHQKQAGFQLSMKNCISAIREIEAMNWKDNFEELSNVEQLLSKDPTQTYEKMDFESRDYYRHEIEKIAKHFKVAESFVAKKAIECTQEAEASEDEIYKKHVGYYIFDDGLKELKAKLRSKQTLVDKICMSIEKRKVSIYILSILILTVLLMTFVMLLSVFKDNDIIIYKYVIAAFALLIPCSEIVTSILNWSINKLAEPKFIPKIDFSEGIPEEYATFVVIPTLVNDADRLRSLINELEVCYLANQEENIFFAILGDYKDSAEEHTENDKNIIQVALKEINELNSKYKTKDEDIFYYFHRYRKYNEKENKWMGWERKRGKLMEFNELLRGSDNTSYDIKSSLDYEKINVKYIITLDADTKLPRNTARKMIGAMAHPLNSAFINKKIKKVRRGYGVMQPKISISNSSANKTIYSRIFSGETGIDTYSSAVSDVYQDLFNEGIFTGKGIYDLEVFTCMLEEEIPENTVLSHDLLEGSFARTALISDTEMVDGYPAYYNSSSLRLHRWVRGDWQIIPWVFKKKPAINMISKWKIVDNLRRSLLAPSIIILTILSFKILPDGLDKWLAIAILSVMSPILFDVSDEVVAPIRGISLSGRINSGKIIFEQVFLIFCFLPYQAFLMLDAIFRTMYRMFISKKNLLQWQTAEDAERFSGKDFKSFIKSMWQGSAISIVIIVLAFLKSLSAGIFFLPYCLLWFLSPLVAYYISKPIVSEENVLTSEQLTMLRRISRKTWAYFEDFICEETNWLSPDNYQEDPANGIAFRTSPTNMAMGIISNIVAHDLGYIGILEVLARLDKIISNMEELKRYKGHFYNWYDIKSKQPLQPEYVSSVDSGNLVGYLWVACQALKEYEESPLMSYNKINGLYDTFKLAQEENQELNLLCDYFNEYSLDIYSWEGILTKIQAVGLSSDYWNSKLKTNVDNYLQEIHLLLPWVANKADSTFDYKKLDDLVTKLPLNQLPYAFGKIIDTTSSDGAGKVIKEHITSGILQINIILDKIKDIAYRLNKISDETDFSILYDKKRQLFSIGYDIEKDSMGNSYYDLLASEARQASFVAIAKGDVEQKHWFKLGRAMTIMGKSKGLVSWSGTMFEYLMPLLIMKNYPNSLLNQTYEAMVEGQKKYSRERKIPWGISESAFYNFDMNMNYQYKAFGVPGIGLKRGLINELVISPYSTLIALQVDLEGAYENIDKLFKEGLEGRYGFYESADYTKERIPKGKKNAIVKCFMIHHQGMSLMALDNIINGKILQNRFHSVPCVKATELLLQEKVPKRIIYDREQHFEHAELQADKQNIIIRSYDTAKTQAPETQLLSNGSYSMMISNSGSGYSKLADMMLYRWREDAVEDSSGFFVYLKDMGNHKYWSAGYEPIKDEGDCYKVNFFLDKAEFIRKDGDISTVMDIAVSNEDNVEVRRVSITNHSMETKIMEVTSYCEVLLTTLKADIVHPAFSNLFITTESSEDPLCVIADRRQRSRDDESRYFMETASVEGEVIGNYQIETSRANFIGRGRTVRNPQILEEDTPLKNTLGAVLDPIISVRRRIKIKPGETCRIAFTIAASNIKAELFELAKKYSEMNSIKRVFELSWTQAQVEMKYMGIKSSQANLYQLMASKVIFINLQMKDREKQIINLNKGQSNLWNYGISGDLPLVVLVVKKDTDLDFVKQLLSAHEYWSIKGLKVDLVIINDQNSIYYQSLQDAIRDIITSSHARDKQNKQGGVFLINSTVMPREDYEYFSAVSRILIDAEKGLMVAQIKNNFKVTKEQLLIEPKELKLNWEPYKLEKENLDFYNDFGGFDVKNDEYVINLKNKKNTPAPWINVISNGNFGFHISESGATYTWNLNSRENKITPWSNDWISDKAGEVMFLRDEIQGNYWNVTSNPIRDSGEYSIRHGYGYSVFIHEESGIVANSTYFVALNSNVKIISVNLKNITDKMRNLSVAYFAQLVLGVVPQDTAQYISTYYDEEHKYLYGKNPYNEHFGKGMAFLKIIGGIEDSYTGSRKEFIGRGQDVSTPAAMKSVRLGNKCGAGEDACLAQITKLCLNIGEEKNIIILLGQEESFEKINHIIDTFSNKKAVDDELIKIKEYWRGILKNLTISTPDKSMDIMMNGWLMYQTVVCRIMARTAFYQSGGAYGFRDQLQDVLSLCYLKPEITRKQILYSASRQFLEGDVQHWWHPIVNSGIRTRFSDDLLWLPYVTLDYIKKTGDYSILEENCSYLQDTVLNEKEDERYSISGTSEISETLYEHCTKAIDRAANFGEHNIPLMGSGDWNDGMNTIGNRGKGESVWLGWFLFDIVKEFIQLCKSRKDHVHEKKYSELKIFLKENLEKNAWDGEWYRRAYFDDGTPLGSIENDECQIDSLAQSWAVISGAASKERCEIAMKSLQKYLVKEDKGMVLLLTPSFSKSSLEPGYIKGYVPGVRENGGQYTHSVTWVILALVKLGKENEAWKIYNMINPINHAKSYVEAEIYKLEPYVMAADVYGCESHIGRGGWSWYTGAAGWMYKVALEGILGFNLVEGKGFSINPCIPKHWPGYSINYRVDNCTYYIEIIRGEEKGFFVDGEIHEGNYCELFKNGDHNVKLII